MEDRKLEAAESLALISSMIENTRNRMVRHSGRPFLVWGYTTVAVTLAVWYTLVTTHNPHWNALWFAIPLIGWPAMWFTCQRRQPREGYATTFIDRVIGQIWLVLGVSAMLLSVMAMFPITRLPILFVMLLMMGIGTTLTSLVIRFTPGIVGGVIGIALTPLLLILNGTPWVLAVFAAGFVVMMIIPGHILNYKARRLCSGN